MRSVNQIGRLADGDAHEEVLKLGEPIDIFFQTDRPLLPCPSLRVGRAAGPLAISNCVKGFLGRAPERFTRGFQSRKQCEKMESAASLRAQVIG
jgi:hypothetical protein